MNMNQIETLLGHRARPQKQKRHRKNDAQITGLQNLQSVKRFEGRSRSNPTASRWYTREGQLAKVMALLRSQRI